VETRCGTLACDAAVFPKNGGLEDSQRQVFRPVMLTSRIGTEHWNSSNPTF
jgi:hypothetical protein